MKSRGDCPASLRRTALSWALSSNDQVRPPGRSDAIHHLVVWCCFADVFNGRQDFEDQLARRRFYRRQLTPVREREHAAD